MKISAISLFIFLLFQFGMVFPAIVDARDKSPIECIENFIEGEEVIWFGEVVSVRAFKNENKETTIEWLCRFYELVEAVDVDAYILAMKNGETTTPLKVRKNVQQQYFVTTLRSMEMPIETANKILSAAKENTYYALRRAQTMFIGEFDSHPAIYIGGGAGSVGKFKVNFID